MGGRRVLTVFLVLMLGFVSLPVASAQATGTTHVQDAADDVRIQQAQEDLGTSPIQNFEHLDVRGVWIANETLDAFEIGVDLAEWSDPYTGNYATERKVVFGFTFNNESYVVVYGENEGPRQECNAGDAVIGTSSNEYMSPWVPQQCLDADIDAGDAILHVPVRKEYVVGSNGIAVQAGDQLTDFFVNVWQRNGLGYFYDRAPDDGYGPDHLLTEGSLESRGHLLLSAVEPIRASNGESTTMVFPVRLANTGDQDDVVLLSAENPHAEWSVRLPARLEVAAGETITFPVILAMEFTHEHGITKTFEVHGESSVDPDAFSQVAMGVHWLEVPQPSGHHPFLWLHSAPSNVDVEVTTTVTGTKYAWFNGLEDDPSVGATDEPVGSYSLPGSGETVWSFPLRPGLQLGLDLDLESFEPGYFETVIHTYAPATDARLVAELWYCDPTGRLPGPAMPVCGSDENPGTRVVLFSGAEEIGALGANADTEITVELEANASAEVIPHQPGSQLYLRVTLHHDTPQSYYLYQNPPAAELDVAASLLHMPLDEYHDPVDQAFLKVGTLRVEALDAHEKPVNPGRTAVFTFAVTNTAEQEQRLAFAAEGVNADWATIHGDEEATLGAGDMKNVTIAVQPPEHAVEGERAELFFVAENVDDPRSVALARFRASVVPPSLQDVPDEADQLATLDAGGDVPSMSALALMSVLAALVILARRNRNRPGGDAERLRSF